MARKSTHKKNKNHTKRHYEKRQLQLKGRRPLDQIQESVRSGKKIEGIEDMPGAGQYACEKCDVYFRDEKTREVHVRTKAHKRREKEFGERQHSMRDAEWAAGLN